MDNSFLFPVLEAGQPKVKAPVDLKSGEGQVPGPQTAVFLYLHMVEGQGVSLGPLLKEH
jgi:hypothetical protein